MVKYFSLLDNVRVNHGGMTKASFRRGKALNEEARIATTILTFNDEPNYASIIRKVREAPDLGNAEVENFYCSLANPATVKAIRLVTGKDTDTVRTDHPRGPSASAHVGEAYTADSSATDGGQQRTYFDPSGRPYLVVDDSNSHTGKPLVTLLSRGLTKRIVFQGPMYRLKHLWLDTLIGDSQAMLTFDDNRVARTFKDYVRPGVGKIFVQHVNHLEGGRHDNVRGPLRKSYRDVFRALGNFDAIVTLSSRQETQVVSRLNPSCWVVTIPNVNYPPTLTEATAERIPRKGVVVTRHAPEKQVIDTVKAFALAHNRNEADSLTVIGGPQDNESYRQVKQFVESEGLSQIVEFEGHQNAAEVRFSEGGFTILSSKYEGFGLVLLEAMGRGAIPVSYDVPYGPKSIISNEEDGFLVPKGDIDALATGIGRAASLAVDDPMRVAAREKSSKFSPARVAEQWTDLYDAISTRFRTLEKLRNLVPAAVGYRLSRDGAVMTVRIDADLHDKIDVQLRLESFDSLLHTDFPATGSAEAPNIYEFRIGKDAKPDAVNEPVGLWLLLQQDGSSTRHRLEWPDDWPQLFMTRTPYGNMNV
ncbi:Glycosyltransferase involved in cell wall bisynthesis [Brevibacterium sandarakinum]|uniref:Glycosyltransferase involved in cell wall bisynthesis n=1 Tax=Brevibacterium sandarakinum TaxID=629680 RepID=A0A1H1V0G3_BRESA|nr:glycosyltransferase [Brevibacterium sandarakinum]SDS78284.1 Glycosyltransferase involved in cell wall bisynthesis [Brevibacterium sandarakinum]